MGPLDKVELVLNDTFLDAFLGTGDSLIRCWSKIWEFMGFTAKLDPLGGGIGGDFIFASLNLGWSAESKLNLIIIVKIHCLAYQTK